MEIPPPSPITQNPSPALRVGRGRDHLLRRTDQRATPRNVAAQLLALLLDLGLILADHHHRVYRFGDLVVRPADALAVGAQRAEQALYCRSIAADVAVLSVLRHQSK